MERSSILILETFKRYSLHLNGSYEPDWSVIADPNVRNLIKKMLIDAPEKRISAANALEHGLFGSGIASSLRLHEAVCRYE